MHTLVGINLLASGIVNNNTVVDGKRHQRVAPSPPHTAPFTRSHLPKHAAAVVDFPFMNPNCSYVFMPTMFLSRFACTCCETLAWCSVVSIVRGVAFILEDMNQDAFSSYVWNLFLISHLVQCVSQNIHSRLSTSQTIRVYTLLSVGWSPRAK